MEINERVVQLMASIENEADNRIRIRQNGKTRKPGFKWYHHRTLEKIIQRHIRAAYVAGLETSIEQLIKEIRRIDAEAIKLPMEQRESWQGELSKAQNKAI